MISKLTNLIISFYFYLVFIAGTMVFAPTAFVVWIFTCSFDKRLQALHMIMSFWGCFYTWINPFWNVEIIDREKFQKGKTYVVISNHQSILDIIVLYRLFRHFKWVSKSENFRIPVIGPIMKLNQYIEIKRGNSRSAHKMFYDCEKAIHGGSSIMIFPEGTRSETLKMRRFKDGAFLLAKDTNTEILPIVVDGAGRAVPKKGIILQGKQDIKVKVLDSIAKEDVERLELKDLKALCQSRMESELNNINRVSYETESKEVLC